MYTHDNDRLLLYWNVGRGHAALSLLPWPDTIIMEVMPSGRKYSWNGAGLSEECVRVPIVAHAPPTHWHARVHSVVLFTRAQRNLLIVCMIWSLDYQ